MAQTGKQSTQTRDNITTAGWCRHKYANKYANANKEQSMQTRSKCQSHNHPRSETDVVEAQLYFHCSCLCRDGSVKLTLLVYFVSHAVVLTLFLVCVLCLPSLDFRFLWYFILMCTIIQQALQADYALVHNMTLAPLLHRKCRKGDVGIELIPIPASQTQCFLCPTCNFKLSNLGH